MSTRVKLALGVTLLAVLVLAAAVVFSHDRVGELLGVLSNLGTELLGLAFTIAFIDWLLERKRLNEQVQHLAWRMLHDLDHAFWVWQGGRREFHLDELMSLLDMADRNDPLPRFTEELFINLGIRASDNLRLQPRLMAHDRRLKAALKSLAGLAQVREAKNIVHSGFIIDGLRSAVTNLAELTGQTPHPGEFAAAKSFRDPSFDAQQRRYRGSLHESIMRAELVTADSGEDDAKH
ncbi:MAG: hypothetical protein H6810_11360 [Phycisphaeraceae bacterium]|nr:MAG: hypothetical protein H6810_11360 [Phycisphaeraceae bacterium]